MGEKMEFFTQDIINSENTAVKDERGNQISYLEAWEQTCAWKDCFPERRLVCVLCDYGFETLVFILQMFMLGQPLMLLSDKEGESFLNPILERYKPRYLWHKKGHEVGKNFLAKRNVGKYCLSEVSKESYKIHSDLAVLLSTSGSTGSPKMVKHSYDSLEESVVCAKREHHIEGNQRGILSAPLDHILGLEYGLCHWLCGATLLATEAPLTSTQFVCFYTSERANNIVGVPFTYKMLRKTKFFEDGERMKNLNAALEGGARLEEEEYYWLVSTLGNKFQVRMGQTETGVISIAKFDKAEMITGTVGKAREHVKVSLDEKGQLIAESKNICMGYAHGWEDLEKGDENGGIFATGDLAEIDKEGYIFLKGRINRIVKILGNRVSLDELEDMLLQDAGDCEFACTGDTDELHIYYVNHSGTEIEKPCRNLLLEKVRIPLDMVRFHALEELPRSSAGKISYSKLDKVAMADADK